MARLLVSFFPAFRGSRSLENFLKVLFGLTLVALFALGVLFLLGAFEMPWFEDVYSRTG